MTSPEPTPAGCPFHTGATALHDPEVVAEPPETLYARLRRTHGPVVPVEIEPGVPAWLVIGYQELLTLTREEHRFSKDPRTWHAVKDGSLAEDSGLRPFVGWRPTLLFADGAEHRRLRMPVTEALAGVDEAAARGRIEAVCDLLINDWAARGRTEADLLADYATRIPLMVITQLIGLPLPDVLRIAQLVLAIVSVRETAHEADAELMKLLGDLVAEHRAEPRDDLTGRMMAHPSALTDEEIAHSLVVCLVTGLPTIHWIANAMRLMLLDDGFRTSLTGGRLTVDDALDQVLWAAAPTTNFPGRWATADTRLGDRDIKAGDMLVLGLGGANTDPAVRPESPMDTIGNRAHMAFGAGPHVCPAQDLARLIAHTAVETLLHRLPDVRLGVEPDQLSWHRTPWARRLETLPVRFSAPTDLGSSADASTPGAASWQTPKPSPAPSPEPPTSRPSEPPSTSRTPGSAQRARRSRWRFPWVSRRG